jgi:hypothetical protein
MMDRRTAAVAAQRRKERGVPADLALDFLGELAASVGGLVLLVGGGAGVWALWQVTPALGVVGAVLIIALLSAGIAKVLYTGPWSARRFLKGLGTLVVYLLATAVSAV